MAKETGKLANHLRDLVGLVTHPREDLSHELKAWLDLSLNESKASLAQAILALANHGGGFVVIGIDNESETEAPGRPEALDQYDQDAVNGIVEKFAEPPFHCSVQMIPHPTTGKRYPVVVVPGTHRVPIRAKRGGPENKHVVKDFYYIRRPGPKSEPPQSGQEWDELMGRCLRASRDELLDRINAILSGAVAEEPGSVQNEKRLVGWIERCVTRWKSLLETKLPDERPNRYAKGYWIFAYMVVGQFAKPSVRQLLEALQKSVGRETGWPPWMASVGGPDGLRPYQHDGLIECWLKDTMWHDAAHSDFWVASPDGMLFLLRGYQEDSVEQVPPGTVMDLTVPAWRVGECLMHSERMAKALGNQDAEVLLQAQWHGLVGRELVSLFGNRGTGVEWKSRDDSVNSELIETTAQEINDNLPSLVQKVTKPLYSAFSFCELPASLFVEEIGEMKKRKQ